MPTFNELISAPVNALVDAYRDKFDARKRTYGESLLKSFTGRTQTPITESDYTLAERKALDQLIKEHYAQKMAQFNRPPAALLQNAKELEKAAAEELGYANSAGASTHAKEKAQANARRYTTQANQLRAAAKGELPTDFAFGYPDYGTRVGLNSFSNDPQGWAQTLGRFRYKINPKTGEYQAYDTYDFNNEAHKYDVQRYADMSAPKRFFNALANTYEGDQYALGEAYLAGPNSVPVTIKGKIK